jgi:hypothetical protein
VASAWRVSVGPTRGGGEELPGYTAVFMRRVIAVCAAVALLTTGSDVAARTAGILWSGSFNLGLTQWTDVQANDGSFTIVPAPGGRGGDAARFLVRPGDVPINASGERAEVYKETGEQEGTTSFWAWSVFFPTGSSSSPNSSWNVFTQWHQSGPNGVQPLSFEITNDRNREWLRMRAWGGDPNNPVRRAWRLAPLVRGRWFDFALRVHWAPDHSGLVQVWLDHRQVVPETRTPTLYAGQSVYLKQGFYREPSGVTSELYIAGTRRGASLADIGITSADTVSRPAKTVKGGATGARAAGEPVSKAPPVIQGIARQGRLLRSTAGAWLNRPARFTYQWQWSRDGGSTWLNVRGARRATFNVDPTFVGARVRLVVTASNAAGSRAAASAAVAPST